MKRLTNIFILIFSFAFAEGVLRLMNFAPAQIRVRSDFSTSYEPDQELGWKNRSIQAADFSYPWGPRRFTTWEDGRRATGEALPTAEGRNIVFVGDSFTQGGGLPDSETFSWRVQERLPGTAVFNYGTGGYGACQSMIRMNRFLSARTASCADTTVVYGMSDFHEARNVAHPYYAYRLARESATRTAHMPYCLAAADGGGIEIHPPETFPVIIPFVSKSSLFTLVEEAYYAIRGRSRAAVQRRTTELLLRTMADRLRACGGRFVVLLMDFAPQAREETKRFLGAEKIEYVDGYLPEETPSALRLPDGHPNEAFHKFWSDLLVEKLFG